MLQNFPLCGPLDHELQSSFMLEKAGESIQGHDLKTLQWKEQQMIVFCLSCFGRGKKSPRWIACNVSDILITYLNHICFTSHPSPQSSSCCFSSPKISFPFFSTLVSPATFLPDHVSGPLVISKSTRGSKRILTTKRSEWPKALLLSHGYYDLTFICMFADI